MYDWLSRVAECATVSIHFSSAAVLHGVASAVFSPLHTLSNLEYAVRSKFDKSIELINNSRSSDEARIRAGLIRHFDGWSLHVSVSWTDLGIYPDILEA